MRKTRPQPPVCLLHEMFFYEDSAECHVNGFHMRGGLLRKNSPRRRVCGTLRQNEPTARAEVGVRGYNVHFLHRIIWIMHEGYIPDGLLVDHRDGDPAHNRFGNLRLLTDSQNQMNRKSSRSDSGLNNPYIGVGVSGNGFNAFGSNKSGPLYLGHFHNAVDAALRRDEYAQEKAPGISTLNRELFPEVENRYHGR